jgi:transmembrane sensor
MSGQRRGDEEAMRRLASAAAWRVRLTEAGLESSATFEAWLAEDPANEAAWRQLSAPWDLLGEQAAHPEVVAARREALARAGARNTATVARGSARRRYWLSGLAAGVAAIAAGAFWVFAQPSEYHTGLGERRVVMLDDGSKVSLDSQTVVQVRYSADARRLRLKRGQARFDVSHNAGRPFSVDAGDRTVIATGTSFNIDLRQSAVVVTLIEGRVLVTPRRQALSLSLLRQQGAAAVPLNAGQTLTTSLEKPTPPHIENVSLDSVTSWESGRLIFNDEPLAAVVEHVARYSSQTILIGDETAAQLRISGVFNAGDVTTFLDTVSRYLPVRVTSQPDGSIVLTSVPQTR